MYLLSVNLYELGQYLQILLWISLPMVLIVLLLTTYLHYRKRRKRQLEEGDVAGYPVETTASPQNSGSFENGEYPDNSENPYKGLLWMKDKYEQYREQTDNKYEKLKEELARSEQKYLDLLAERAEQKKSADPASDPAASLAGPDKSTIPGEKFSEDPLLPANNFAQETVPEQPSTPDPVAEKERQIGFLHVELDQRIKNYHELEYQNREDKARAEELAGQYLQSQQLLEVQQLKIDELNARLGQEMSKVADLTGKLENNMRLLLHIHQELDSSLHPDNKLATAEALTPDENKDDWELGKEENQPGQDQLLPLPEDTKIVGWVECEEVKEQV
jgi:hypothetical protein